MLETSILSIQCTSIHGLRCLCLGHCLHYLSSQQLPWLNLITQGRRRTEEKISYKWSHRSPMQQRLWEKFLKKEKDGFHSTGGERNINEPKTKAQWRLMEALAPECSVAHLQVLFCCHFPIYDRGYINIKRPMMRILSMYSLIRLLKNWM